MKIKNINGLPDYILLQIFKRLDTQSLENSANVCQRWNYLANTNELWIYKCKLLGNSEKLFQIEKVIYDELQEDEDIDWKQAFSELVQFVLKLKTEYYKNLISEFDKNLSDEAPLISAVTKPIDRRKNSLIMSSAMSEAYSRRDSLISEAVGSSVNLTKRRCMLMFFSLI